MTAVEVTQKVAHEVIRMATKKFIVTQIEERTDIDTDENIPVWIVSFVGSEIVATQSDKVTKPMIEKGAARITAWRNRKNQEETSEGGAA